MSFKIFQNKKTPFQDIKARSLISRKNEIFTWFWSKIDHFSIFFFPAIYARKTCFMIVQNEKTPFQAIKTRSSKTRKIKIFQGGQSMLLVKNQPFFYVFLVIQARKMSFTINQNEKTPFQAIKTRSSKSQKTEIFLKGLVHDFCQKLAIFPSFYFRQYTPENVFYDGIE